MRQPVLFLSHGAPMFMLEENATTRFWQSLPQRLSAQPRVLLCVSAHWDATAFQLSGLSGKTGILHDFYGFPAALYDIKWDEYENSATGAWLLSRLQGLNLQLEEVSRPKDHGVWMPLKTAWPKVDFPVYQLSMNLAQGLDAHWDLGQRLSALRDDGVLIVASGGITHNLSTLDWNAAENTSLPWAASFVDAVEQAITNNDRVALCNPWQFENGKKCHPTVEHYVPLLVMLGAADREPVQALHRNWMYGTFALHVYGTDMRD